VSITFELKYVTRNGELEIAVSPPVVTLTGEYVAPVGTVTVNEFDDAPVTVAFTAPKYTTLFVGMVLKFDPETVTELPIVPLPGLIVVITGDWEKARPARTMLNVTINRKSLAILFITNDGCKKMFLF
jgi:hypothetical protein